MVGNTSWIYQGRQEHGWFGNGTGPGASQENQQTTSDYWGYLFKPGNVGDRVDYAARTVIGHLSRRDRVAAAGFFDRNSLGKLRNDVIATYAASQMTRNAFRQQFFDS